MLKKYAIIVAGGSGTRMQSAQPKQFIPLKGIPVLMRTINAFMQYDTELEIIVVLPESQTPYWNQLCEEKAFSVKHCVIKGGETRYHSVSNGLAAIDGEGLVAIHDGVRPFVSKELISRAFNKAQEAGAAIPVLPVKDSIREVQGSESKALDRNKYYLVQTPQCFQVGLIKQAFEGDYKDIFTDDATVAEAAGQKVELVEGEPYNIKLTAPLDLRFAEVLIDEGK